jgi:hypothetical protein
MSVQSPSTLPSPEDLAWVSDLLAVAAGKLIEIEECLSAAFEYEKVGENLYRAQREFVPPTLEDLGRLLLLAHDAHDSATIINESADKLEECALRLYREQNDATGLVPGPAGAEPYPDYRRRLAAMYRAAAEDAEAVVSNLEQRKGGAS